jgi:hypothetical protein
MICKEMAVIIAAGQGPRGENGKASERGSGSGGAGLGADPIPGEDNLGSEQAVRVSVLRRKAFHGRGGWLNETGAIPLRG